MLEIPYQQLSDEALQGLVEEFITREGTDYGERELSLAAKVALVMSQLQSGKAVVVFDEVLQSCTIAAV